MSDLSDTPGQPEGIDLAGLFRQQAEGLGGAVRGVLGGRCDVQEVLQEAFLRAWRALDGGVPPRDPVAWVYVVTLNLAKDLRRRERRRGPKVSIEEVELMDEQATARAPERRLERKEAVAAARAAIHRLGDKQKEVFLLRQSGGLSYEAIASNLGIPVGTAKTRMRAALISLRTNLAAHAEGRAW